MTIRTIVAKAGHTIKKKSPTIFTIAGVVGLGATAYLAYKSRDAVEAVVEGIEEARNNDEPVDKVQVARDLVDALWQPVVVGGLSIASILMAHRIQSNRIKFLMGALVTQQARNAYFEKKYRKDHGDAAYSKFVAPVDEIEHIEEGKNGKEKKTIESVKAETDKSIGQWYSDSSEYASDDHSYNVEYIKAVNDRLQTTLFQRGHLLLNEVRDALGFERIRAGALLGWSTGDYFSIQTHINNCGNIEDGDSIEQIWVTWTTAKYIYDDVEFSGRYSVYEE